MRTVSVADAKNRLSALLKLVRAGQTVTITDRGMPVARLVPINTADRPADDRLDALASQGLVVRSEHALNLKEMKRRRIRLPAGASLSDLLLEERREDAR
jgi:prevent-host-death family protein